MDINTKYVKQTFDALSDSRLVTGVVAANIAKLPVREQTRFFKLAINYIEVLSEYGHKGYALMGMQDVAKACMELMEVIENHFPVERPQQMLFEGMEYVQI
jgi:hypothetical protein